MDLLVSKLSPIRRWAVSYYYRKLFNRYAADICRAKEAFNDERSARVLDGLLSAYTTKNNDGAQLFTRMADLSGITPGPRTLPKQYRLPGINYEIREADNLYFLPDLFSFSQSVVLLDGGAFVGDTLQLASRVLGERLHYAYAFEPNPKSFDTLKKVAEDLPFPTRLYQNAICSVTELSHFSERGSYTRLDNRGTLLVQTIEIGSFLEQLEKTPGALLPNFIKLDIEGCEPEALISMSGYLRRNKPDLAISTYHHVEDLWQMPLLLRAICPDYQLYLRHHSNYFTETVLYATVANHTSPSEERGANHER